MSYILPRTFGIFTSFPIAGSKKKLHPQLLEDKAGDTTVLDGDAH